VAARRPGRLLSRGGDVHGDCQVLLGLDVGKDGQHAVALAGSAWTTPRWSTLRQPFDRLARHERILVVVGQPASIGALPVAVARALRP
jgi:hypothetical protein